MKPLKTWFYKDGIDKEPIPILLIGMCDYGNFNVITYREINDGNLKHYENAVIYLGKNELGGNLIPFPEIKTKYCKSCGSAGKECFDDEG